MFFIDSNDNNSKHTVDDINSANSVLLLDCCVKLQLYNNQEANICRCSLLVRISSTFASCIIEGIHIERIK